MNKRTQFVKSSCMMMPILAALAVLLATPLSAGAADELKLDAQALKRWGSAQYVFIGKLTAVQAGPVGRSFPPIYTHRLMLTVETALRGPTKKDDKLQCSHSARQKAPPIFPQGKSCIVSANATRGNIVVTAIEEATKENVAAAKQACSIPLGWTVKDGKLVSPWASLGDKAWPKDAKVADAKNKLRCSVTGRPAYTAGKIISVTVAFVPPVKRIQWANPDGDGQYKITVTNPTDKPVEVPALLTDGKNILWAQSLVIVCQDKTYTVPGSKGVATLALGATVGPTKLAPRQSVFTMVNALKLQGPKWPRGGYRIAFQFCLGEHGNVQSFYYLSKHHDVVRQKLLKP